VAGLGSHWAGVRGKVMNFGPTQNSAISNWKRYYL
jgi:hypothetical protein